MAQPIGPPTYLRLPPPYEPPEHGQRTPPDPGGIVPPPNPYGARQPNVLAQLLGNLIAPASGPPLPHPSGTALYPWNTPQPWHVIADAYGARPVHRSYQALLELLAGL